MHGCTRKQEMKTRLFWKCNLNQHIYIISNLPQHRQSWNHASASSPAKWAQPGTELKNTIFKHWLGLSFDVSSRKGDRHYRLFFFITGSLWLSTPAPQRRQQMFTPHPSWHSFFSSDAFFSHIPTLDTIILIGQDQLEGMFSRMSLVPCYRGFCQAANANLAYIILSHLQ